MIGQQIGTALEKVFKKAKAFDPASPHGKQPATLRELFEWEPTGSDLLFNFHFPRENKGVRHFGKPVSFGRKAACPHRAPQYCNPGFFKVFHEWLVEKRIVRGLYIDHDLTYPLPWPILERFEEELSKRGHMSMDDIFGEWVPYENWQDITQMPAYMPLYDLNCDDETVPLIEFLESRHEAKFPEAAYEVYRDSGAETQEQSDMRCDVACRVFKAVCDEKRWRLLPGNWKKAMKFLSTYEPILGFWDYESCRVDIEENGIDHLFECCREVNAMHAAVDPLVIECGMRPNEFWNNIVTHMWKVASTHYREFIENAKKERIKVRV